MKKVLLKDINGDEFHVYPNEIINIVETKENTIVKLNDLEIIVISNKQTLQSAIHNCYLP